MKLWFGAFVACIVWAVVGTLVMEFGGLPPWSADGSPSAAFLFWRTAPLGGIALIFAVTFAWTIFMLLVLTFAVPPTRTRR